MGQVRFRATSDMSEAKKTIDQLQAEMAKLRAKMADVTAESKRAQKANTAAADAAKRASEVERKGLSGVADMLGKVKKGSLDLKQVSQAVRDEQKRLADVVAKGGPQAAEATRKYRQELKAAADMLGRVNKGTVSVASAQARLTAETKAAGTAARKAGDEQTKATMRGTDALRKQLAEQRQVRGQQTGGTAELGKQQGLLSGAVGQVAKLAGGYLSIRTAMTLVNDEIRSMIESQRRMKEASMTLAEVQVGALRNLGATSDAEREAFTEKITAMASETGVTQKDLYGRASAALSARGELSVDDAMAAVRESAMLVPESSAEGTAVAGAALDIAKISGTADAKKNIGMLMAIGQTARVTDVGLLAENVAPALTGVTARGGSVQEAGALWAALTGGMADPTGRKAGTASIQLAEQLAETLPTQDVFREETDAEQSARVKQQMGPVLGLFDRLQQGTLTYGSGKRKLTGFEAARARLAELESQARSQGDAGLAGQIAAAGGQLTRLESGEIGYDEAEAAVMGPKRQVLDTAGTGLTTTMQRIRYLQENESARKAFLADANFETKAKASVEQILAGTGSAADALDQYLTRIPDIDQAGAVYQQRLGVQRRDPLQQTARLSRQLDVGLEQIQTADQDAARAGALREKIATIMQDTGSSALGEKWDRMTSDASGWLGASTSGQLESFAREVAARRDELLSTKTRIEVDDADMLTGGLGGSGSRLVTDTVTETERKQAEALGQILQVLEQINRQTTEANQQRQQDAAERTTARRGRVVPQTSTHSE